MEELGSFLVHRDRRPLVRHRLSCDLAALRERVKDKPASARAEIALTMLREGKVHMVLMQDWLEDLSPKDRLERLGAFLDAHWAGAEPWRQRKSVQQYLAFFNASADTGDWVQLAFAPSGRIWFWDRRHPKGMVLLDRDLSRALLDGLLGPKVVDPAMREGVKAVLEARLHP